MLDSTVPLMVLMLIWKTLFPQFIDDDHELMKVPCMDEGLEEFCTICKKLLLDGSSLSKPSSCSCASFHHQCLEEWLNNAVSGDSIGCPSCKIPFSSLTPVSPPFVDQFKPAVNPPSLESNALFQLSSVLHTPQSTTVESAIQCAPPPPPNAVSLAEALEAQMNAEMLKVSSKDQDNDKMKIDVRRGHEFEDGFKEIEDLSVEGWKPRFRVSFNLESGCDTGGLSREFFSLLFASVTCSSLLSGTMPNLTFSHDSNMLLEGKYKTLGKLVALSLLNGHVGPQFFSPTVVQYILNQSMIQDVESMLKELPKGCKDLKERLEKIYVCENQEGFNELVSADNLSERFDFGYSSPKVTMQDKVKLIQAACRHYLVSSCLEDTQSFMDGLRTYGVLSCLRQFPKESVKFFTHDKLTVADIEDVFKPVLSEKDSNRREREDQLYYFWIKFLKECNRGRILREVVKLEDVLEQTEPLSTIESTKTILTLADVIQFLTGSRFKTISSVKG